MTKINEQVVLGKIGERYKPSVGHIIESDKKLYKVVAIIDKKHYGLDGEHSRTTTEIFLRNLTKKGIVGTTLKCFTNTFSRHHRFDVHKSEHGVYEHEYTVKTDHLLYGLASLERDMTSRGCIPFKI